MAFKESPYRSNEMPLGSRNISHENGYRREKTNASLLKLPLGSSYHNSPKIESETNKTYIKHLSNKNSDLKSSDGGWVESVTVKAKVVDGI